MNYDFKMGINTIFLILALCADVLLGILVYLKGRKKLVNIVFGVLAFTIAVWTISIIYMESRWYDPDLDVLKQAVKIAYATGTFPIASFIFFSAIFPYGSLNKAKKYLFFLCPIAFALAATSLSDNSIKEIIFVDNEINAEYGIVIQIWTIYAAISYGIILYNLGSKWIKGNGIDKQRIQYVFLGVVLTTTFIGLTNIFVPFLLGYANLSRFGPYFVMIMVACIAYAIIKLRLMDIRVFIKKGIAYSLLLAVTALAIGLLVVGIPHIFPNLGNGQYVLVSLLTGSFIVFALRPLNHALKELIDDFILKDQQYYQEALNNFAQKASKTLDLKKLLDLAFETTVDILKVEKGSLWLLDEERELYAPAIILGLRSDDMPADFSSENDIIQHLISTRKPIIREELENSLPIEDYDRIETCFRELKSEALIPLFAEDRLIGIMNLDTKSTGRIYYKEDIDLIEFIIEQSSIAIQNAMLHQQILQAENLASIGQLSAELAHEIKNPLLTIKTCLQLSLEHECEVGIDKDFFMLALDETDKIDRHIRQLLNLARSKSPNFAWCDVNQVIGNTIKKLRTATSGNIEFVDLRSYDLPEIYADKEQIDQVFFNIGLNAIEAMGNGGRLTIETLLRLNNSSDLYFTNQEMGDSIVIRICDTGRGMSKEELRNVFNPFYSKKNTGTGLGLAIVRNIIREHKGLIDVNSSKESGTVFTIEFPLNAERSSIIKQLEAG